MVEPLKPFRTRTLVSEPVPIESGRFRPMQKVEEPEIEVIVGNPPPAALQVRDGVGRAAAPARSRS